MRELRQARIADHSTIVKSVQQWWGDSRTPTQARELSLLLPKLFLQFFSPFTAPWGSPSKAGTEWSMVSPCTATTTVLVRTGCAST